MIDKILNIIVDFFELGVFFYCNGILLSYWVIGIVSYFEVKKYRKETRNENFEELLSSPFLPSISIIAPAYNESVTIVDNIRSLLSLHYTNLTVIVVNDGSKDETLETAINAYDLEKVDWAYNMKVDTKNVRGVYKSKNPAFSKLIFVDKENGGKADAINVGINVSSAEYFACIDVDCIIEPDAFLKMVRPIMRNTKERVIAVGGIVWLTNDSEVKQGKLIDLKMPSKFIPRIQVLEYFRAFLLGRTAWGKINGLLLISGAFGIFERKLVVEAGGYNHNTVGEDMELVMRLHAHVRERKEKGRVAYIPEPLCWTEAPGDYTILGRQRNRWTRGTIECLLLHKKMFLNPKYGILGLLSYPYWLLAEWLAPYVEFFGLIFFFIMALFGYANWHFFFYMIFLVYAMAVSISSFAIFTQERTYGSYTRIGDLLKIFYTAAIEAFKYHPRTVKWSLKGNLDFFTGKNTGWGEMTRAGFQKKD